MVSFCGIKFKVHYWPLITFCWFALTFAITYSVGAKHDHFNWFFPYISDIGDLPPESCIFSQLVNIGTIFLYIIVYVRHREIEGAINAGLINTSPVLNNACLWIGWLRCLGISMVANFQLSAQYVRELHIYAARLSFLLAEVFFILQTVISWQYYHNVTTGTFKLGCLIFYFRVYIVIAFFPCGIAYVTCYRLRIAQFTGESMKFWSVNDKGYTYNLVSAFCQWIIVFNELIYVATFTKELKNMRFRKIKFESNYT